ncbi:HNH endonuclease [Mesorhizobium sp. M0924]|uniref:hypothetical protein n=1 Tax=unclassified Mesorhizobium TaxID=325217 RepID=UPI00333D81C4
MRGDNSPTVELSRYWKFAWDDLAYLPPLGKPDYQPKGGAFRFSDTEGRFFGEYLEDFPAQKVRSKLPSLGHCAFCGRSKQANGQPLKLTSEHVLPEFLGAGLELPRASCNTCQKVTAAFEHSIATEMFDPVRKNWAIEGKSGYTISMQVRRHLRTTKSTNIKPGDRYRRFLPDDRQNWSRLR